MNTSDYSFYTMKTNPETQQLHSTSLITLNNSITQQPTQDYKPARLPPPVLTYEHEHSI